MFHIPWLTIESNFLHGLDPHVLGKQKSTCFRRKNSPCSVQTRMFPFTVTFTWKLGAYFFWFWQILTSFPELISGETCQFSQILWYPTHNLYVFPQSIHENSCFPIFPGKFPWYCHPMEYQSVSFLVFKGWWSPEVNPFTLRSGGLFLRRRVARELHRSGLCGGPSHTASHCGASPTWDIRSSSL